MPKPVVIVGAGLAGLACARELHRAGVYFLLLDADDRPGGRVKTDVVEGFKLDRGFQVLFTDYPNADDIVDFDALHLGAFRKNVGVFDGARTTILDRRASFFDKLKLAKSGVISMHDLKLLKQWQDHADAVSLAEISRMNDKTCAEALRDQGFSDSFITKLAKPFYAGVFMEKDLQTSRRQMMFVTKMAVEGDTALPEDGMEAIPRQIAEDLPGYLFRMDTRVAEIIKDGKGASGVRLDTSEVIEAFAVVIATEADEAARLSGMPTCEGFNSSTTLYFETPIPCVDSATIVLNGSGHGLVNEVIPVTQAQPKYAPAGRHLAAVSIIGLRGESDEALEATVKEELGAWFPKGNLTMWRFLRSYRIRYHQMAQTPGVLARLPQNTTEVPGLFLAGEFTENASIDGAIRSGLACGQAILAQIGAEAVA